LRDGRCVTIMMDMTSTAAVTAETITRHQIRALRESAWLYQDAKLVATCTVALNEVVDADGNDVESSGDAIASARGQCAIAINNALAAAGAVER
jgi:hypothetical protein